MGSCTFTGSAGTDLTAYAQGGEVTWAKNSHSSYSAASLVLTDANRVRNNQSGESLYYSSTVPASADYAVTCSVTFKSLINNNYGGPSIRMVSNSNTWIKVGYNANSQRWDIVQRIGGSSATLASFYDNVAVTNVRKITHGAVAGIAFVEIRLSDNTLIGRASATTTVAAASRQGLWFNGTQSNSTGAHVDDYSEAALDPILVASPLPYAVIQRDGSSQADIVVSGSYTGTPTAIEARWKGGAWATIDASPAGNVFSGTLTNQQAYAGDSQGDLEVRFTNDTDSSATVPFVGIGDIIVIAGQSNASGRGTNSQVWTAATSYPTLVPSLFSNGYNYQGLYDPTDFDAGGDNIADDGSAAGSIWPLMAGAIMEHTGCPVMFVPCSKGGSGSDEWQPGVDHVDRTTLYGSMNYRIGQVGGAALVCWWQGETDGLSAVSQATYNANLDAVADAVQADRGIKLMPCRLQTCGAISDVNEAAIRAAIIEAEGNNSNIEPGPDLQGITTDIDGLHLNGDAKLISAAELWATAINAVLDSAPEVPGGETVINVVNLSCVNLVIG